jgi:hypothetical protein
MKMFHARSGSAQSRHHGRRHRSTCPAGTAVVGLDKVLDIGGLDFVHPIRDVVRYKIVQDIVSAYEQAGGSPDMPIDVFAADEQKDEPSTPCAGAPGKRWPTPKG